MNVIHHGQARWQACWQIIAKQASWVRIRAYLRTSSTGWDVRQCLNQVPAAILPHGEKVQPGLFDRSLLFLSSHLRDFFLLSFILFLEGGFSKPRRFIDYDILGSGSDFFIHFRKKHRFSDFLSPRGGSDRR